MDGAGWSRMPKAVFPRGGGRQIWTSQPQLVRPRPSRRGRHGSSPHVPGGLAPQAPVGAGACGPAPAALSATFFAKGDFVDGVRIGHWIRFCAKGDFVGGVRIGHGLLFADTAADSLEHRVCPAAAGLCRGLVFQRRETSS